MWLQEVLERQVAEYDTNQAAMVAAREAARKLTAAIPATTRFPGIVLKRLVAIADAAQAEAQRVRTEQQQAAEAARLAAEAAQAEAAERVRAANDAASAGEAEAAAAAAAATAAAAVAAEAEAARVRQRAVDDALAAQVQAELAGAFFI